MTTLQELKDIRTVNKTLTRMLIKKNRQLKLRNALINDYERLTRRILRHYKKDLNVAVLIMGAVAFFAFAIGLIL